MALLINPSQRLLLVNLLFYSTFGSLAVVPLAESDYNFVTLLFNMLQYADFGCYLCSVSHVLLKASSCFPFQKVVLIG